jgi:signal transduction histidine kinase
MKFFFNLSYRYKVPLWSSLLIVLTALAVSASFMASDYRDLQTDLAGESIGMGYSLKSGLFQAMLNDDVWHAFEIITEASYRSNTNRVQVESILLVDNAQHVFVSSQPKQIPMLANFGELSLEFAKIAIVIKRMQNEPSKTVYLNDSSHYYSLIRIEKDSMILGTLIIVHSKAVFMPLFVENARFGLASGALILTILLPFNWYWGRRMAYPLVQLADRMSQLGKQWPDKLDESLYQHHDEIGQLFKAYSLLLNDLKSKEALELRIVESERLAALGRLAAGVAHEINNPLSGMLTAIDTLKLYSDLNPRTKKTIALIERGLVQIKDTVAALLVEAKINGRNLTLEDINDVLMLITPMANKKALTIVWYNHITEDLPVPANCVRQILINLLLNAVQAATLEISFDIHVEQDLLYIVVDNDGKMLSKEQISHLFEPFSALSEDGHGLGLWVTYQIINQLGGNICVKNKANKRMHFAILIPLKD